MAKDDPHFRLRVPAALKARVEDAAKRNNRSVNAEIVQALTQVYPPEPSVEEVLSSIESALRFAQRPGTVPYRKGLIEALEQLQRRLASGLEFDQFRRTTEPKIDMSHTAHLYRRWKKALESGVEQSDLERELEDGIFDGVGRDRMNAAIKMLADGRLERAMISLGMGWVKFAEPQAAAEAIEKRLRSFYADNWGDPDELIDSWSDD